MVHVLLVIQHLWLVFVLLFFHVRVLGILDVVNFDWGLRCCILFLFFLNHFVELLIWVQFLVFVRRI